MRPIECLVRGIRLSWSGAIEVVDSDGEPLGQIVISRGKVAWATHARQSETLGVFLWRLGRITREQLNLVSKIYRDSGGKKKLGAILEEQQLISHPVLRRCLLLHLRNALEGIFGEQQAIARMAPGPHTADERFLFNAAEIVSPLAAPPELSGLVDDLGLDLGWQDTWFTLNRENLVLRGLTTVPGYMASAVFSFDGDVVVAHNAGVNMDLGRFGVTAAAVVEGAARAAAWAPLGRLATVSICCDHGLLTAAWLHSERYYFVSVLTRGNGDPVAVRQRIEECLPSLNAHLLPAKDEGAESRPVSPVDTTLPAAMGMAR